MSIKGLLDSTARPSDDDIRLAVSGNLCRCGAYQHIIRAGRLAADRMAQGRAYGATAGH